MEKLHIVMDRGQNAHIELWTWLILNADFCKISSESFRIAVPLCRLGAPQFLPDLTVYLVWGGSGGRNKVILITDL